jgi:predicted RNase H-like HicB family nuclease
MTEPMTASFNVSAVLYQEGDWWIAQCLEYDIATQADSFSNLQYELERVLFAHICASISEGRKPFDLPAAPRKFWNMWDAGTGVDRRQVSFRPQTPMPLPSIGLTQKIGELHTANEYLPGQTEGEAALS